MTEERFREIFEKDGSMEIFSNLKDDNAFIGLQIIRKYLPTKGVQGADHDVIYSVSVDDIVVAGITEEDAVYLRDINWMIENDGLACFV